MSPYAYSPNDSWEAIALSTSSFGRPVSAEIIAFPVPMCHPSSEAPSSGRFDSVIVGHEIVHFLLLAELDSVRIYIFPSSLLWSAIQVTLTQVRYGSRWQEWAAGRCPDQRLKSPVRLTSLLTSGRVAGSGCRRARLSVRSPHRWE